MAGFGGPRCWRCWPQSHHAPLDWLMEVNRKPLRISFVVVGCVAASFVVSYLIFDVGTVAVVAVATDVVICTFAALILSRRMSLPVAVELGIVLGAFMLIVACGAAALISSDSWSFRVRSHSSQIFWKTLPAVFGFPLIPSLIFNFWVLMAEAASLELCSVFHGDTSELRVHGAAVVQTAGWIAVAWMNSGRLCSIYDAQEALAAEKMLMESIINMMCDAMVWISEDGQTVLRTDQRFQMILGRSCVNEGVDTALAPGEQERLQNSLMQAKTAPQLLPTTLLTASKIQIPVEMFIVGGRDATNSRDKQGPRPAYLIGVRTTSREGSQMLEGSEMRQEHAGLLAAHREQAQAEAQPEDLMSQSVLSSVPETTATGRIFDRVDLARWLEGTAGDRAEELRESLERVIGLGQTEHWLMSPKEVTIAANEILGAGAFGVVCGGWLHGSPVAVKTTRRSADSSNAEHLVTIANEIRILRHVRHPNIVLFHGACVEPARGEVMLVLERVKGGDLHQYVMEHATDAEVYCRFQLLLDVACALRYLHAQHPCIVHGDLKDKNILVECPASRAKLVDFGLSRLLTKSVRPLGGTLTWMAPEIIIRSSTRPEPSADVFSFGRLAYLVIACKRPLEGIRRSVIEDMAKSGATHAMLWQEDRPLHRECRSMCDRLLSFTPEQRPDMAEVHREVSAWRLPSLDVNMPALELVRAEEGSRTGAGATRSLREVLSSALHRHRQGATGGATPASPADSNTSPNPPGVEARGELFLPWRMPTQEVAKKLMIMEMLMQWNCRAPPGSCCKYHATLAELQRQGALMMSAQCNQMFQPHEQCQCDGCGVLDVSTHKHCPICDKQSSWACSLSSIKESGEEESEQTGVASAPATSAAVASTPTTVSL